MRNSILGAIVPVVTGVVGAAALAVWVFQGPAVASKERVPGTDRLVGQISEVPGDVREAKLETFDGRPSALTGAWPRFRGAGFDNIAHDDTPLARTWAKGGPPVLWSIDVGEGYAGAAVRNGRVYLLDYDPANRSDALRCLSLDDGSDIWRYSYPVRVKRNHGMSRTVPTVTDKYVVTLGPKCHLLCTDALTGQRKWMLDLVTDFGATVPPWYAGQSPLIDDGRAIIAVGSDDVLMMAVDCESGEIVWRTPNEPRWRMSHSSVMPMQIGGRRTYVYVAHGGVAGVAADTGELLWSTDAWKIKIATIPSPVVLGSQRIFLSGGYNAGSMMLQLTEVSDVGGRIATEPLWRLKAKVFGAAQQTPILYRGNLYGVRPSGELVCLDLSGGVVWSSGSTHRFALGPFLIADGLIFLMNDHGVLTLAEATPNGYNQLAQAKVLEGPQSWGPMALVGGRLIVRDLTRVVCLDVGRR